MAIRRNAQRDYDIYVRRMNGETITSLAKEFELCMQRIVQIVDKTKHDCEVAKKYSEAKENNFKGLNGIDILMARYSAFVEQGVIVRAYNALRIAKSYNDYGEWSFERFMEKANLYSYEQLLKCRNIGVKTAEFITMVREDLAA